MLDGHTLGGMTEIEMHIDVDIELTRLFEDPVDLAGRHAVHIGCAADHPAATLQAFDDQFIGARQVEQAVLGKDADVDIDGPFVFVDQRQDALEGSQANDRVDLQMGAHMGRALQDGLFQRADRTLTNLLGLEVPFRLGDLGHRFFQGTFLGLAAVQQARFVEMDVRLDEARRDEPARDVQLRSVGRQTAFDGDKLAVLDGYIDRRAVLVAGDPCVAQYEIHNIPRSIALLSGAGFTRARHPACVPSPRR